MKKLLPILLALLGIVGGVGAGFALRPAPEMPTVTAVAKEEVAAKEEEPEEKGPAVGKAYIKLNNQFVVPVITSDRVSALVVLSISVEVDEGDTQGVFSREPKLRDAFLQVLFDHANIGGFDGAFTNSNTMEVLRNALQEASRHAVGDVISDVLITEIVRQDV